VIEILIENFEGKQSRRINGLLIDMFEKTEQSYERVIDYNFETEPSHDRIIVMF